MDITRRRFINCLFSGALLSAFPFPALAEKTLPLIFGQLPERRPYTLLSAGAPADLLLLALAPEMLLGLSSYDLSAFKNGYLSSTLSKLPRLGKLSGRASTLSLEKVLALNPDMIIDCGMTDGTFRSLAQRTAEQTGIPYVLVDGNLQDSPRQLRQVGELLGVSQRAESQARLAEQFLQDAANFAKESSRLPCFYAARGATGLETGLQGSLHTEAAELPGFINVARQPQRHGLAQVSFEQLLLWDPDLILTQNANTFQHIRQNPLWKNLRAVREGQLLCFPGFPFGWLDAPPGINRLLGMRRLQAHFDNRLRDSWPHDLRQFFRLFYHTHLNEAQCRRLLEAA